MSKAGNKQRITRLSKREADASEATGYVWGAGIIPRDESIAVLKNYGVTGDAANSVLDGAVDELGRYRMDENFREKRLSRSEILKQARATGDVARELYGRILNIDPYIQAIVDERAFKAGIDVLFLQSGMDYLARVVAFMQAAEAEVAAWPSKKGAQTRHRNVLLSAVIDLLDRHCGGLGRVKVRALAGELLECWGVTVPRDDNKVRAAVKGTK